METGIQTEVLVVEDSPTQAMELQFLLEQSGYQVTLAANGKAALDALHRHAPTLVISDIVMPEMDGYELCRRIRADEDLRDLPVMLLTSLSDRSAILGGLLCGATNFITKPYDGDYLLSRLDNILRTVELRKGCDAKEGLPVFFAGERHCVAAERAQMLDLLLSVYETAVRQNAELARARDELRAMNDSLEEKIAERTADLVAEMAERRRAEEQLLRSQKVEAVGRLAGGVAHDFNNLLTIINGYSNFLLDSMGENDPGRIDVEEIKKAGDRAAALTRQLLAFTRRQAMEPRVLSLNEVVASLEKMLRRLIGEDIILVTVYGEDLGLVLADPGQMEQAIVNLVVNARDAMPGGGQLTIETMNAGVDADTEAADAGIRSASWVKLTVTDSGTGMPKDVQARIFDPFFTTKEEGKGTGLGLSVVYGIVQQSGGCIRVHSVEGRGTTFDISLPRTEQPEESEPASGVSDEPPGGTETVLVAEDEEMILKIAVRTLTDLGYNVLQAPNGAEALSLASQHDGTIHLLLTDVVMPGMNGRELAQQLRTVKAGLKVIYMSGHMDDSLMRAGLMTSTAPFLQKPFTTEALALKVRAVLDG